MELSDAGEELRCVYKLLKGNESGGGGDCSVHSFPAEQTRESQFEYLAPALTTWVRSHSNIMLSKRDPVSKVKVGHGRGRHQTLNFGFHCTHTHWCMGMTPVGSLSERDCNWVLLSADSGVPEDLSLVWSSRIYLHDFFVSPFPICKRWTEPQTAGVGLECRHLCTTWNCWLLRKLYLTHDSNSLPTIPALVDSLTFRTFRMWSRILEVALSADICFSCM